MTSDPRLHLPTVTLCAVTSINLQPTIRALNECLKQVRFARCLLLTDLPQVASPPEVERVPIARLTSAEAYSNFMIAQLPDYVETDHCLVVQWDGHIVNAANWQDEFLACDYIGASWPQFHDGHDVGNGGFSLRSKRLMDACRDADFIERHPEDVMICRAYRPLLESRGIRFAPRDLADRFSAERSGQTGKAFGYHGIWNMPEAIGLEAFWQVYCTLDEPQIVPRDATRLIRQVLAGPQGLRRAMRLAKDYVAATVNWRR